MTSFVFIGFLDGILTYSYPETLKGTRVGLMYKLSFNSGSL